MNALEKPISLCAGFIEKIYSLLSGLLILLVTLFLIAIEKIFNALENPFAQLAVVVLFAIYTVSYTHLNLPITKLAAALNPSFTNSSS